MVVMPADHVIKPAERFQAAIQQAAAMVEESPGRIVTFGIKPSYPAEIFGYIHRGVPLASGASPPPRVCQRGRGRHGSSAFTVLEFQEKPNTATAKKYVDSGEYYWNSGIFVWRRRDNPRCPSYTTT